MPWIEKDKLFFVHIPRCSGTSITKFHRVREKAKGNQNIYHWQVFFSMTMIIFVIDS